MKTVNITSWGLVKLILKIIAGLLGVFLLILIAITNTFKENVESIIFILLLFLSLSLIGTYLKRRDEKNES